MNDLKWMKKPITIEAWQFTEQMALEYWHSRTLPPFGCNYIAGSYQREIVYDAYFYIDTLEGRMKACLGDWIIKGVKGEIYPCKPDIFEATYTRPKQPAQAQGVDDKLIAKMAGVYEAERARYVGGTAYYPNNMAAHIGAMTKALAELSTKTTQEERG